MDFVRRARRLAAEEEAIAGQEGEIAQPLVAARRKEDQAASDGSTRIEKGGPPSVTHNLDHFPIVHGRPPQRLIR